MGSLWDLWIKYSERPEASDVTVWGFSAPHIYLPIRVTKLPVIQHNGELIFLISCHYFNHSSAGHSTYLTWTTFHLWSEFTKEILTSQISLILLIIYIFLILLSCEVLLNFFLFLGFKVNGSSFYWEKGKQGRLHQILSPQNSDCNAEAESSLFSSLGSVQVIFILWIYSAPSLSLLVYNSTYQLTFYWIFKCYWIFDPF